MKRINLVIVLVATFLLLGSSASVACSWVCGYTTVPTGEYRGICLSFPDDDFAPFCFESPTDCVVWLPTCEDGYVPI